MSLSYTEISNLQAACRKLDKGKDYRCDDFIENLFVTVLDFYMNADVVDAAVRHFRRHHGFKTMRKLKDALAEFPDTKKGNTKLAQLLWNNNHWTRANFLRAMVAEFDERGVRGQSALRRWVTDADFEKDVKGQFRSSRHSIGYAIFQWLRLRCGDDTVKPDIHVRRFVEDAIGRMPSKSETVNALERIAAKIGWKPYRLDSAIWQYQKDR